MSATVIEKSSQKEEPEFEPEKDDEFADNDEEEPFGDDFDDFEEGGGEEDDFDDFDDGFQQAEPLQSPQPPPSAGIQVPALPFVSFSFAYCVERRCILTDVCRSPYLTLKAWIRTLSCLP